MEGSRISFAHHEPIGGWSVGIFQSTSTRLQIWLGQRTMEQNLPIGAEQAVFTDTRVHVLDFLAARERHLRELGFTPEKVAALVPSERGKHYSEAGFHNLRVDTFKDAGIEGDYRVQ